MASSRLAGQVALVTGASYGLGRAISEALAARGATLVLTDVDQRLKATRDELESAGHKVSAVRIDVTDRDSFRAGVAEAMAVHGRLDILINNAGYSRTVLPIMDMDLDEWELSMHINVRGALFGVQEACRAMIEGGRGGRVVNIASTAAFRPYKQKSAYCVSKSALVAFTRAAALELAEHRITVNAIAPGQTDTETTRLLQSDPKYGEGMRRRAEAIPLGMGGSADISSGVVFFVSPEAGQVTGQTMIIDGGTLLV